MYRCIRRGFAILDPVRMFKGRAIPFRPHVTATSLQPPPLHPPLILLPSSSYSWHCHPSVHDHPSLSYQNPSQATSILYERERERMHCYSTLTTNTCTRPFSFSVFGDANWLIALKYSGKWYLNRRGRKIYFYSNGKRIFGEFSKKKYWYYNNCIVILILWYDTDIIGTRFLWNNY